MCLNRAVHPLSMFGSISYKCTVCVQFLFIISMYTLIINNNMFFLQTSYIQTYVFESCKHSNWIHRRLWAIGEI